jgi:hypothetical protein
MWSALAIILIVVAMIVGGRTRSDEHKASTHKAAGLVVHTIGASAA